MDFNPYLQRKLSAESLKQGGTGYIESPQDTFMNLVWQTRKAPPDEYQQALSETLSRLFADGVDRIEDIVCSLEASDVRPPGLEHWDENIFLSEMARLAD